MVLDALLWNHPPLGTELRSHIVSFPSVPRQMYTGGILYSCPTALAALVVMHLAASHGAVSMKPPVTQSGPLDGTQHQVRRGPQMAHLQNVANALGWIGKRAGLSEDLSGPMFQPANVSLPLLKPKD